MGEEKTGSVDRQTDSNTNRFSRSKTGPFCFGCEQQSSYEKDCER